MVRKHIFRATHDSRECIALHSARRDVCEAMAALGILVAARASESDVYLILLIMLAIPPLVASVYIPSTRCMVHGVRTKGLGARCSVSANYPQKPLFWFSGVFRVIR